MAEIDYPEGLPLPLRDDYRLRHQSPTVEAEAITGRSITRRNFRNPPSFVMLRWSFSEAQAQLFEVWYRAEKSQGGIADGTIWFNCPLQTPIGLKHYEAKFKGMYEDLELFGINHWRTRAILELKERQVLPPESLEFPQYILYSDVIDIVATVKWPPQT